MKRLKVFFALVLLLFFFPLWRNADLVVIFSPWDWPVILTLTGTFAIFLGVPTKLLIPKIRIQLLMIGIFLFGTSAYYLPAVSNMTTKGPGLKHCGALTWAGTFYPIRNILPEAYIDDIEARNQMCWLRKMIKRVPSDLDSPVELAQYINLTREKLLAPEMKYRAVLPLIALLHFNILKNFESNINLSGPNEGEIFVESLHFWQNQYTILISEREYGVASFPHSEWVKFEYGLIERNWDAILEGLKFE
jgi:hypothetical protein